MADFSWRSASPLSQVLFAGRHGESRGGAGVAIAELREFSLVQMMARRGKWEALSTAAQLEFGAAAPAAPRAVAVGDATLIWSGPDQFLALTARAESTPIDRFKKRFAGVASISDQSDGRALLRINGTKARDMLAKLCSLDLHPAAFPAGAAAATSMDHTGVNLWRGQDDADGGPVFYLLVLATFAVSLWETIVDTGAEYGVEVDDSDARAWLPEPEGGSLPGSDRL